METIFKSSLGVQMDAFLREIGPIKIPVDLRCFFLSTWRLVIDQHVWST